MSIRRFFTFGIRWRIRCLALGIGLIARVGTPATIQLAVETQTDLASRDQIRLRLAVENRGNTVAHDLTLFHADSGLLFDGPATLRPGEQAHLQPMLPLPSALHPGRHITLVMLRYRDAEGGRASLSLAVPFSWPTADATPSAPPPLALAARPVKLSRTGTLRIVGASLAGQPLPLRLRLALPDEIEAPELPTSWLAPTAGGQFDIPLVNREARPGSRYPVTVIAAFEHAGRHDVLSAETHVTIVTDPPPPRRWRPFWLACALLALIAALLRRRFSPLTMPQPPAGTTRAMRELLFDLALVGGATLVVLAQVAPPELLHDTTTVGGDLVAHHYIVARLRASLFEQGRIIAWAPGWWGGFPLFQYYFFLPYLVIVLLGTLLPEWLAFKIGVILGLAATPLCAWLAGRQAGLHRPLPTLLSLATLPLLLDTTHTMWGVNAYSTLAGMIANSYSFALMLPALGCALHDARQGRGRLVTLLLLSAVVASHFFTALLLALLLAAMPLLPGLGFRRALRGLAPLGLLTLLLCAGWWLPLMVKRSWSVDFGENWTVYPWRQLPLAIRWLGLPALAGLALSLRRRDIWTPASRTFGLLCLLLLALAGVLFTWGHALHPVFVNVRLWPFIVFATLSLIALTAGIWIRRSSVGSVLTLAFACLLLALAWDDPSHVRHWARDNFRGLERRTAARDVFENLVDPLDGTPGRLAYDLHPDNERLGSSRVFELTPFRIDKPILEGGLVNSALGALPAYLIQGEISDQTAGFPPIVKPQTFDVDAASAHLVWMNVRHFIARSPRTRDALSDSPWWQAVRTAGPWTLFESTAHDGGHVRVLDREPTPVRTRTFQADLMEWLYRPGAVANPYVYLLPGMSPPTLGPPPVSADTYHRQLRAFDSQPPPAPDRLFDRSPIRSETVSPGLIRFDTMALNRPHLVAESWFPNWQAEGALGPFPVSPTLMLVYPFQNDVVLRYADLPIDRLARLLSLAGGLLVAFFWVWRPSRRRRHPVNAANDASIRP